jgi:hypothetical protein
MARWKLREAHYIHAIRDGNRAEWVYKEINRVNGREIQKKFPVPMHLDPKMEIDWTHKPDHFEDGYIVVALAGTTDHKDIIIEKESVTPGMDPIDDEAKAISAEISKRYIPIEGANPEQTYSANLLDHYIQQLAEAHSTASTANAGNVAGINKVLESMTAMMEQNQKILIALVEPRGRRL